MAIRDQKADTVLRVLNAAEALVRKTGDTDFSMLTLASKAKVSPATPYNLFGSKGSILYTLLNRSLDEISKGFEQAFSRSNPYERVLKSAKSAARVFLTDPVFYRPLYKFLLGVSDAVHRPAFMDRSHTFWRSAVDGIDEAHLLPKDIGPNELARQFMIQFTGALDLWVHEELSNSQFEAQITYGTGLVLLGISTGADREMLMSVIRSAKRRLPK